MAEIAYKLTAEEKQAVDAIRKVAEAFSGVEGGVKKVSEETKRLQREQDELARAAKRVYDETRTPMEQHQERLQRLSQMVQAGKIDQETYGRAASQSYAQMEAGLEKTRAKVGEVGQSLKQVGEAGRSAFGQEAVSGLVNYAMGILSITSAAVLAKRSFDELGRIKEEAARNARESEFGYGSLAEVSGGDPQKFKDNVALARGIAAKTGMNENQAARLTFALSSAGSLGEADTFADAYKAGVVQDPEVLLRSATAMRRAFGNRRTNEQTLDIAFKAAEGSPSQATALLAAAAGSGAYARMAGIDEEQLLAATAVNASVLDISGGAQMGGTGVRALLKAMGRLSAPMEAAPVYTEEEFQRDKEALAKERQDVTAAARTAARNDPAYLSQIRSLETQKAALPKLRRGASAETVADRQMRLRQIGEAEQAALRESETRIEQTDQYRNIASTFKMREEALVARRKASASGIATDEDGNVIDDSTQKIRQAAAVAIAKAGPNLLDQLKAVQAMGLNNAQLQKVFGRSEGLVAMSNILANERNYTELLEGERHGKGYFRQVLELPQGDKVLQGAKLERIGKGKIRESDRDLATENQIYEAVWAERYSKEGKVGKTLMSTIDPTLNYLIPGNKRAAIQNAVQTGDLESNPELLDASVTLLGGEEKAFAPTLHGPLSDRYRQRYRKIMGKPIEPGYEADTQDVKKWDGAKEVVDGLKRVEDAIERGNQDRRQNAGSSTRSTLGSRHGDPGDKR